ncbi:MULTISPECIES: DUF883 family protein [unclassified Beijerinckia]|uniref:DUF883 family protein n=1 Tax=unclassified Beijerinckia TaxID=2638183 RepID=UPI000896DD96|nr:MULTISPECIES: DUF883 family protein [unclassified Beijerinckia]MDH7797757.1 ElaB/YqjD/DUF883 family membrane-anchored ribosome-binding protein [Beijerinckia sp. GAS462]SEC97570.1 Membrane-anchored ribosome-binding protein, inhibits growth in stationary phase, ElaB/YqjD/DUF883 family [Beijerinckia sp. 28-YEA-48]
MAQVDDIEKFGRKLTDDYTALREDISKLSETVAKLVSRQADVAGDRVAEAVGTAKAALADSAERAQDKVKGIGADIESSIERNPYSAVLIALGVGLALGLLNRSR